MEQMNFETKKPETKFSWREKAGKLLKLSGIPITIGMFLASCGEGKENIDKSTLSNLKEQGKVAVISPEAILDAEAIIQKAKDEKKTIFYFDNNETVLDVDTVQNIIELSQHVNLKSGGKDDSYSFGKAIGLGADEVKYNYYFGAGGTNSAMQFEADRETAVVKKAIVDKGVEDVGYGIAADGSIIGDKGIGEEAVKDFSETVKTIREKMVSQKE